MFKPKLCQKSKLYISFLWIALSVKFLLVHDRAWIVFLSVCSGILVTFFSPKNCRVGKRATMNSIINPDFTARLPTIPHLMRL